MVQAALQQWLSEVIEIRDVRAEAIENLLRVNVVYRLTGDDEERRTTVEGRL
jgi:hypothetical protein